MEISDILFHLFSWGIATIVAVLIGSWWQHRKRQNNVKNPKTMQSSTDIEETSIDPPLDQNKTVTNEEEDLPPQLKKKGEEKTSIDISIGQNEKITEKDENHPLHLTKKDEEKTSINPPGSQNEKITKKNEDHQFHLTQKDEETTSIDPPVSQDEKPTKEDKNHSLSLTKEGREKTSIHPPLSQNEKPTMDEEHCTLRLADSLLQKSEIISTGSPAVYKLPTELIMRQEKDKITKKSVGSPIDLGGRGTEKVLMVVGATGAGKTTLINGMINYILGVKWEDNFRYKLVVEDSEVSQAHSQTKDITAYTFHPMKGSTVPYRFTIIDTPGFGDTEGLKRDKEITNQIKEFFSIPPPNGIDHLDGIGFVTQASLARLTPTQEYIFDSVLSIFGKDVAKNIFMLVTFADGQKPPVMEAIKNAKIPAQKFYKFNNSALFANNVKKNQKTVDGDEEEDDEFDSMFWKMGISSFKKFFSNFEKSQSVSLQLTQEVLREREQLQNMIEGLNPQIKMGLGKIEEMRQEENILRQREAEIEQNKEFTYEVNITKPKRIDLSGTGRHTTTCLRCNYTCHENCAYADDNDKLNCSAIDFHGYCTVCTQHCFWNEHKNLPYIYEYETLTETRTSEDLKKKYEAAKSGKTKVEGMIGNLEEFLLNVHTNVLTMIIKVQQSLQRLDEIALKPNPLTQIEYLELLIETEKNEAKEGWKQRVEYYEEAKRQAEMLSKVKDVKAAEKQIKDKESSGDKWYSRFMFWK